MGFLYSWDRIRRGQIPRLTDFDAVRSRVKDVLYEHPGVVAATVYGSVARGDVTPRSDFDLLVIARSADAQCIQGLIEDVMLFAQERYVVMSVHAYTVAQARAGDHKFGPSYRLTLQRLVAQGIAKGLPHKYLLCNTQNDIRFEMRGHMLRVRQRLAGIHAHYKADVTTGTNDEIEHWLEEQNPIGSYRSPSFHTYINVARRMLWWKYGVLLIDGKDEVCRAFIDDINFRSLQRDFKTLWKADAGYDRLLQSVQEGDVQRGVYLKTVRTLAVIVFATATRLLRNALKFMNNRPTTDQPIRAQTSASLRRVAA